MTTTETKAGRTVVAQISTTLDGRVSGPKGPDDMDAVAGYAGSDAAHARSAEALAAATTALMGRVNYEGFYGYWPPVALDETADPRDRNIARWLDDVEKVVFSTTMTDAPWANSRIADRGPIEEVQQLRGTDGGDILVVNSVSIIHQLLAGEQLDRLLIDLVPEVAGGGATLFRDGLPSASWSLTDAVTADDGALLLTYDWGVATRLAAAEDAAMTDTAAVIDRFNAAFRERAPGKLVDLIAADCVMEGTGPAPDGNVWTGYDECLAGWQGLASDPTIQFEVEHVDVDGDRAVIRWRVTGAQDYRGVNLMRVRDGKIVEALGYGKRP